METPKAVEISLHTCPVVGCHSRFSRQVILSNHLGNGCCSPHHPLRHFLDLKMPAAVGFACPACNPPYCNWVFTNADQHLKTCGHNNKLVHPVAIGGYGCPQCLAIYPTQVQAMQHIHNNNHHQIYPEFIGDMTPCSSSQALVMPLAVMRHLMMTHQAVPWHLKCMTCNINIGPYNNELDGLFKTSAGMKVKPHVKNGHSLLLDARKTMTEAVSILLSKAFTCTRCLCLLEVCPPSQMHQCSRSVAGQVVSVSAIRLQDFLLRSALSSITPVNAQNHLRFQTLHHQPTAVRYRALAQPTPVENNYNNSNSSGFMQEKNNVMKRINELKISNNSTDGEIHRGKNNFVDVPPKEWPSNHTESQTVSDPSSAVHVISLNSSSEGSSDSDSMEIPPMSSSSRVLGDNTLRSDIVIEVSSDSADDFGDNAELATSRMKKTQVTPAYGGPSGSSQTVSSLSRKRAASGEDCAKTSPIKKPRLSSESQGQENSRIPTCPDFIPFSSAASDKPSCSLAQSTTACSSPPNIFDRVVRTFRNCIDHLCLRNGNFPQDIGSTTTAAPPNSQFHQYSAVASQLSVPAVNSNHSKNGQRIGSSSSKAGRSSAAVTPGTSAAQGLQSCNSSASKTKQCWAHGKQRYFSFQTSAGPSTSRPNPSSVQRNIVLMPAIPRVQSGVNRLNSDADLGDTEPQNLESMNHIIFLDLDNWSKFFQLLPCKLPEKTFVWGFLGGKNVWNEPVNDSVYEDAKSHGLVHIHKRCGTSKDAADFAICLMVGRTDERIPKHIPFTILSGDRGFEELERQYRGSQRRLVVITPHLRDKYELYVLLKSVADS